ncbi:hypothetical protein HDU82_003208, partial [Entophlyctis luteolus]
KVHAPAGSTSGGEFAAWRDCVAGILPALLLTVMTLEILEGNVGHLDTVVLGAGSAGCGAPVRKFVGALVKSVVAACAAASSCEGLSLWPG